MITLAMEERIIVQALRLVHTGGTFFPVQSLVDRVDPKPGFSNAHEDHSLASAAELPFAEPLIERLESLPAELARLTPRERTVHRYLCQRYTNKMIARALSISDNTVKVHVSRIKTKLGVGSCLEFAFRFLDGERHFLA